MITIKINEIEKHRNETTFRPYLENRTRNLFYDIGIKFVFDGNRYDLLWVGHDSYMKKTLPYSSSVEYGVNANKSLPGDIIFFDGQDSPSLIGSWDVFKQNKKNKLLLKNSLYQNREWYKSPSVHGRYYWGSDGQNDYSITDDIDWSKIKLSGTNWLSTIGRNFNMYDYRNIKKDYDVCALFSYPSKENKEFAVTINQYYDSFRKKCIDNLPKNLKVITLDNTGQKLPIEQYYDYMRRSKIIIAPFGYGEIAPRDLEAAMFGSVLIKPDMSHVDTIPNIYIPFHTFVPCDWDFSNLQDRIDFILSDWKQNQEKFVVNFRNEFNNEYLPEKLIVHTHDWISQLDSFTTE